MSERACAFKTFKRGRRYRGVWRAFFLMITYVVNYIYIYNEFEFVYMDMVNACTYTFPYIYI